MHIYIFSLFSLLVRFWCFLLWWPQLPFDFFYLTLLLHIGTKCLISSSIFMKVFWVVISVSWILFDNYTDSSVICEPYTHVWPSRTLASGTYHLLCSAPKLPHFGRADIPCMDLSITFYVITRLCSSLFMVTNVSLVYNNASKMVLWKRLAWRFLLNFALYHDECFLPWFYPSGDFCIHDIAHIKICPYKVCSFTTSI